MKKDLWFINRFNEYFLVKEDIKEEDIFTYIKRFVKMRNPNFTIYYVRTWLKEPNVTEYDVGSHSEFFETRPSDNPPKENIKKGNTK